MVTTRSSAYQTHEKPLTQRHNASLASSEEYELLSSESDQEEPPKYEKNPLLKLESFLMPLLFFGAALFTRMYKIGINDHVVWDEAHFGKFGSYYLRHEFYHDVHPPLGKMLVGFSGYLAGYNGSWDFPSGEKYPDGIDYVKMRMFNALFSALCAPLAYFTAKAIGFSLPTVWLFSILVVFENSYATIARFILLDSMLLFFTVASYFAFVKFHNERSRPFSRKWWKWMFLLGVSLGCTISVKMVGLFVITLVGVYTVADLWNKIGEEGQTRSGFASHFAARALCLIIVPMAIFLFCFKIHFDLLTNSGPGDANMPSLFQAGLHGSEVGLGPRNIALGSSIVSIKNQALGGALLHSHIQTYPDGSNQQQVTCYGHKDSNNHWKFDRKRGLKPYNETTDNSTLEFIRNNGEYRLVHINTGRNLHTHPIKAPISHSNWEVSGYGNNEVGDPKDNWVIEIVDQPTDEDEEMLHTLSSSFRIRNTELGCYLAQTGSHLPEWGFRQAEVACVKNPFKRDKRTWWNIETNENELLPRPENFKYPKTSFIKDFIHLNLAMMATNNALVPDPDKQDILASSAWQWPTLNVGIRLCAWGDERPRYFLMGSPASTWPSTVSVLLFVFVIIFYLLKWQRQVRVFNDPSDQNLFLVGGIYPFLGWALHFIPFVIMSRVTYVHHYLPALYFALLVLAYFFEVAMKSWSFTRKGQSTRIFIYFAYYVIVIYGFYYFSPISFGMTGPTKDYAYLDWRKTWTIS